jgi:hypothetical protein
MDQNSGETADKEIVVAQQGDAEPKPAVEDPESEKRLGIKEEARNEEAIAQEKMKAEKAEKPSAKPSFFVRKTSRHIIKMDVLTSKEDGRIVSISKSGLGIDFDKDFPFLTHTELVFEFSIPNYEDMSTYRQRSAVYRREAQQVIVDKLQLRNFLLVWHLKGWNLPDDDGKAIELKMDENGSLSEESLAMVYALSPTLLDVVMTIMEKDVLLS